MHSTPLEQWEGGDLYERYMGRWSAQVAARFLGWLGLGPRQRWLDVGCGTGALTRAVSAAAAPARVVGIDSSLSFVRYAQQQIGEASFAVADAGGLPVRDHAYDAAISGLALNFLPEPARMVSEMRRAIRPSGTVAAYVWDYSAGMELLRYFWDAAAELDARASALHEGYRFPICRPEPLRELWQAADLNEVVVTATDIPAHFASFEDYWSLFLTGDFPAPKYALSLDAPRRDALRDQLRRALPMAEDSSIHLIARAWAVRGVR